MKDEYDFTDAKRGAVVPQTGKSRITMYVDSAVLDEFRRRADESGRGYQTLMNEVLRDSLRETAGLEEILRKVIREEMARGGCSVSAGRLRDVSAEELRLAAGNGDDGE